MVTFTKDGGQVLFANEGEPNSYNQPDSVDPEGSVSIVAVPRFRTAANGGAAVVNPQQYVRTVSFTAFNAGGPRHAELPVGVRIYGPGASVAQDLEPEYISVADDNKSAVVTLQENNTVAEIDLKGANVKKIRALGLKNHSVAANTLDASDRDSKVNIRTWPVRGMYEPDGVATFLDGSTQYVVTANEGDARDWPGFSEEVRIGAGSVVLDPTTFPDAASLKQNANLGRLNVTSTSPTNAAGRFTELRALRRPLVLDLDDRTAASSSTAATTSSRSPPQPTRGSSTPATTTTPSTTAATTRARSRRASRVGDVDGRTYAFIGARAHRRHHGLRHHRPRKPAFVQYTNPADFTVARRAETDSGSEGVQFVDAAHSPTLSPLVVVSNEVSGAVNVFGVSDPDGARHTQPVAEQRR